MTSSWHYMKNNQIYLWHMYTDIKFFMLTYLFYTKIHKYINIHPNLDSGINENSQNLKRYFLNHSIINFRSFQEEYIFEQNGTNSSPDKYGMCFKIFKMLMILYFCTIIVGQLSKTVRCEPAFVRDIFHLNSTLFIGRYK